MAHISDDIKKKIKDIQDDLYHSGHDTWHIKDTLRNDNIAVGSVSPGEKLTVGGSVSAINGDVWADNVSLKSLYTIINNNSANWEIGGSTSTITNLTGDWESTYTTVYGNSAFWSLVYTNVNTNSSDWNSTYSLLYDLSARWNNNYTTTNINSANWNSTYTIVNINSADWGADITNITNNFYLSGDINEVVIVSIYSTVNNNSANWSNAYTQLNLLSSNWQDTYTNFSINSSDWESTYTTVLDLSAAWNSAYSNVNANSADWSNHTIIDHLTGDWESAYTTVFNTSANWNDKYSKSDSDSRYVNVTGDNMTGQLISTHDIISNNVSLTSIDYRVNNISSISSNWNNVYTNVSVNSSDWESTFSNVRENSANWANHTVISSLTSEWDSAYTSLNSLSSKWNSNYSTTNTNSANWNSAYTTIIANSSDWSEHTSLTQITDLTGDWESTYTFVSNNSANWNSVYSNVNVNSSDWVNKYTRLEADTRFVNITGDDMTGRLTSTKDIIANNVSLTATNVKINNISSVSSNWNTAYSSILANSADWIAHTIIYHLTGDWNSGFTTTKLNSANWNNVYTNVSVNSSDWESTFSNVRDNSANWSNHANISELTGEWDSAYTSLNTLSSRWNSNYSSTNINSANWNNVYSLVGSNSSDWENSVDGSGAANYIPLWNDSTTLGNSVVYQNSNNLGIGTTTPTAGLHLYGKDVKVNGLTYPDGPYSVSKSLSAAPQFEYVSRKGFAAGSTDQILNISYSGSKGSHGELGLYLISLGLRYNTEVFLFQLESNYYNPYRYGIRQLFNTTYPSYSRVVQPILITNTSTDFELEFQLDGIEDDWHYASVMRIDPGSPSGVTFSTAITGQSGTNVMPEDVLGYYGGVIKHTGIGTTNPSEMLDVWYDSNDNSNIRINRLSTGSEGSLILRTNSSEKWELGNRGDTTDDFNLYSHTQLANVISVKDSSGNVSVSGDVAVSGSITRGGNAVLDTTSTLNSLNDVTITLPLSGDFLKYNGSIWTESVITEADISDLGTYLSDGDHWTKSGGNIYRASGNVGIGTTSPSSKFHIYNSAVTGAAAPNTTYDGIVLDASIASYINLRSPSTGTVYGGVLFSDDVRAAGAIIYKHSTDDLLFFGKGSFTQIASFDSAGDFNVSGNIEIGGTGVTEERNITLQTATGYDTKISLREATSLYGFDLRYEAIGNDFRIDRYDGGSLRKVLTVPRTTGIVDFSLTPTVSGSYDVLISNDIIDEDNFASNSASKIPTQQSVKAYVDTLTDTITGANFWETSTSGDYQPTSTNTDVWLVRDTSDGSDTKRFGIAGGGDLTNSRGGYVYVAGNEHASAPGWTVVVGGSTGFVYMNSDGGVRISRTSGDPSIKAYSDSYMIIDSSGGYTSINHYVSDNIALAYGGGNVGIGTTTASYKLQTVGEIYASSNIRTGDKFIASRYGFAGTYNSAQVQGIWSIGDTFQIDTGADDFGNLYGLGYAFNLNGGSPLAGVHQIVISNNGVVGGAIGLTGGAYFSQTVGIGAVGSTSYKLDVTGNTRVTGTLSVTSNLSGDNGVFTGDVRSSTGTFTSITQSGNSVIDNSDIIDEDSMASNSAVKVPTQQSVKAYVDSLVSGTSGQWLESGANLYRASGNVGIGSSSPAYKLDISGTLRVTGIITATAESHILYNWRISDSTYGSSYAALTNSTLSEAGGNYAFMQSNTGGTYINSPTGGFVSIRINNSSVVQVDASSNVGIGTSTISAKLQIYGSSELMRLQDSSTTGSPYVSFYQTSTRRAYIQFKDSGNNLVFASEYGGFQFAVTGSANALTINSTGDTTIHNDITVLGALSGTSGDFNGEVSSNAFIADTSNLNMYYKSTTQTISGSSTSEWEISSTYENDTAYASAPGVVEASTTGFTFTKAGVYEVEYRLNVIGVGGGSPGPTTAKLVLDNIDDDNIYNKSTSVAHIVSGEYNVLTARCFINVAASSTLFLQIATGSTAVKINVAGSYIICRKI